MPRHGGGRRVRHEQGLYALTVRSRVPGSGRRRSGRTACTGRGRRCARDETASRPACTHSPYRDPFSGTCSRFGTCEGASESSGASERSRGHLIVIRGHQRRRCGRSSRGGKRGHTLRGHTPHTEGAHRGMHSCTREARRHKRYELTGRGQPEQMQGRVCEEAG